MNDIITGPDYIVEVEFNLDDFSLSYHFGNLIIPANTNVLWKINNLPEHWSCYLEFINQDDPSDNNFIGPFEQVTATSEGLMGRNCRELPSRWTFRVLAQRGLVSFGIDQATGVIGPSRKLTVEGQGETISVIVIVEDQNGQPTLKAEPEHVNLKPGRRVSWDFTDVMKNNPSAQPFVSYSRNPITEGDRKVPNFSYGPFVGFIHSPGFVLGYGNNGIKGIYSYEVFALDLTARSLSLISSGDPQTDNEGDSSSGTDQ